MTVQDYYTRLSVAKGDLGDAWRALHFTSFNGTQICRLCHWHDDGFFRELRLVGNHPGSDGCDCEIPAAIMTLLKLDCYQHGSRLILAYPEKK